MKLNFFISIIGKTIEEIKECKKMGNIAATKTEKSKYLALLITNILFLLVYLIPIIYSFVMIVGAFIYGPIVLLGLIMCFPFILFVLLIKVKAYPEMKKNFLRAHNKS
ncbi:hypothetical protein [Metabacillus litoralis]|uniref:hypothetical protein n=1 Tax=Metabacillus litoralis TaxID=152268 RepID=UPI000EF5CFAE|nr:hypothetical protein [Metabacillus litoralis]